MAANLGCSTNLIDAVAAIFPGERIEHNVRILLSQKIKDTHGCDIGRADFTHPQRRGPSNRCSVLETPSSHIPVHLKQKNPTSSSTARLNLNPTPPTKRPELASILPAVQGSVDLKVFNGNIIV